MNLYATKGAVNARLVPLVDRLARAGVTPDQVTLAAVPVAVIGGACLLLSTSLPALLLAVPVLAVLRLVLNLIDGNMARRTGKIHPRGELYNELGDRLADVAMLAPVAFLPGASPQIVLLGVLVGVMASYVGITARAAGGERIYRGILSKPGRMALLVACSLWAFIAGPADTLAWTVFGPILLAGTTLTLLERIVVAVRRLP
jgi:CDP-diacylglycerol---glycerol-3-phosphate 3-phosphatidyltransferase